ncbi:MAG: glycosyltransferase family 4 protein [Alkaliphilus sp.]|nr:glycosyltransferase family 4 protein [Alkaliphilus sp.]
MKRLLIVNNIPTPYRTFMFNKMFDRGKSFNIEVSVAFQACREKRRLWKPEDFDMKFPYFISTGLKSRRSKPVNLFKYTTLNADIISKVISGDYDWIMMAAFMSVTNWVLSLIPSKSKKLLWSESNLMSAHYMGFLDKYFKKLLVGQYDALVCPGKYAVEYITFLAPKMKNKMVLWMPNIVDTQNFREKVIALKENRSELRQSFGIGKDELIIFGSGRLVNTKGFDCLLKAAAEIKGRYKLCIAGSGPEKASYEELINRNAMADRVRLLGQISEEEVVKWLSCADWFIHPARKDPSPLVIIEALNAGLPMAVSQNTGNAPESVIENVNGITFDQDDQNKVNTAFGRIVNTDVSSLLKMGQASMEIARSKLDPDIVVDRFFQALLQLR